MDFCMSLEVVVKFSHRPLKPTEIFGSGTGDVWMMQTDQFHGNGVCGDHARSLSYRICRDHFNLTCSLPDQEWLSFIGLGYAGTKEKIRKALFYDTCWGDPGRVGGAPLHATMNFATMLPWWPWKDEETQTYIKTQHNLQIYCVYKLLVTQETSEIFIWARYIRPNIMTWIPLEWSYKIALIFYIKETVRVRTLGCLWT